MKLELQMKKPFVVFAVKLRCYMSVVLKTPIKIMIYTAIVSMKFIHVNLQMVHDCCLENTCISHKTMQYTAIVSM